MLSLYYRLGCLYLKLHKGSEKLPPDRLEDFEPDLRKHDDKEFHPKYVNFVHYKVIIINNLIAEIAT